MRGRDDEEEEVRRATEQANVALEDGVVIFGVESADG